MSFLSFLTAALLSLSFLCYICICDLLPFSSSALVSPSTFTNPPTHSLAHHFLFPSTYSFSTICHSLLSLGKLQLFYVLDLPPHPSPPLCLFPSGTPPRGCLSRLFSARLHYRLFYALGMSAHVCSGGSEKESVVCAQLCLSLLHPHFPP